MQDILSSIKVSTQCPGSTQPPIQWALSFFLGVKRPEIEADHLPPFSTFMAWKRINLLAFNYLFIFIYLPYGPVTGQVKTSGYEVSNQGVTSEQ